mgnify:CR=1 FL=1|jgi:hypothetical protein
MGSSGDVLALVGVWVVWGHLEAVACMETLSHVL